MACFDQWDVNRNDYASFNQRFLESIACIYWLPQAAQTLEACLLCTTTQWRLTNALLHEKVPKDAHQIKLCVCAYVGGSDAMRKNFTYFPVSWIFTGLYLRNLFNGKMKKRHAKSKSIWINMTAQMFLFSSFQIFHAVIVYAV